MFRNGIPSPTPLASGEVCERLLVFDMVLKGKRITFLYFDFDGMIAAEGIVSVVVASPDQQLKL